MTGSASGTEIYINKNSRIDRIEESVSKLRETSALTEDSEKSEFEITDSEGNAIMIFKDGDFRTRNFDSSKIRIENGVIKTSSFDSSYIPHAENGDGDYLQIQDEKGNVGAVIPPRTISVAEDNEVNDDISIEDEKGRSILQVRKGHIITRYFNSKDFEKVLSKIDKFSESEEKLIRDIPENRGVTNAYKKAQQLINLKWTALSPVYDQYGKASDTYPRKMDSIPYSEILNTDKYVGTNVSIYTFMTAANNPHSLLYTEDLRKTGTVSGKATPSSGYGFTYENYDGTTYIGSYFGDVCNSFVLWCLGIKTNYYSFLFKWLAEVGKFEVLYDNTAQGVKLMDMLWEPGHVAFVTDIYRNDRGEIKRLFLSEHNGLIVTREYTAEGFQRRIDTNGGVLYRYKDLYKNLDYTPSVFSPVGDEVFLPFKYNNDIVTFAGDKAAFVMGQIIYLNYNKGKYTKVEIVKDGDYLTSLTLPEDANSHRLNLTNMGLGYGMYKARLSNDNDFSEYTEFEVIDAVVSQQPVGNEHKIFFSSNKGNAEWISVCTNNGRHKAVYELTESDKKNGYAQFNIRALSEAQRLTGSDPDALDKRDIADMELFVKVFFSGEFGIIANKMIAIEVK